MRSVTNPLPESAGYGVGGVYPAVGVQHILGDVLGVDTVLTKKESVNYVFWLKKASIKLLL